MTHADLVHRAEKWLINSRGCGFVFTELVACTANGETPDAIGWKQGISTLVECKASRADFLADKKKSFRKDPESGIGRWRYYLTLPGMINPEDLPPGWGLLYCRPKRIDRVVDPMKGNCFYYNPPFKSSFQSEIDLLCSAVRRIHIRGDLYKIYEPLTNFPKEKKQP